jgi:GTP-binding protein
LNSRRENFIPNAGLNGGERGNGGDVILVGDEKTNDLSVQRFTARAKIENGKHGMGSEKYGRNDKRCFLKVPIRTVILDSIMKNSVPEVIQYRQEISLVKDRRGAKGNVNFKSSTNQVPRHTAPGTPGEEGNFDFIRKTIADVGLVGFPNAGKSTPIGILTDATPKVANYPFTTLHANIGIITDGRSGGKIILADFPGLIEGAHENRGLGIRFLKHIERCSSLLFLIDMSGMDNRSLEYDYSVLLEELKCYDTNLLSKTRMVIANKMDSESAQEN